MHKARAVPAAAAADYEALRQAVLDGSRGDRELGLALLIRRGMAAWIRAWSACAAPSPAAEQCEPRMPLPAGLRGEVTRLLVTMAFSAHHQEVSR